MPDNQPNQPDFPVVRRGYDPQAVVAYLQQVERVLHERVAAAEARYASLERDLAEAHSREEAVHLTLVAATKTKEELIVNAQREADETLSRSKQQADGLLAEAKKEAFRLVADARQTAEEASAMAREDAKQITMRAEASADATRDAARREAVEMINTVETDTASLLKAHEAALADMRRKYEEEEAQLTARIKVLRATASDLDARLRAIATGGMAEAATTLAAETTPEPNWTTPAPTPAGSMPATTMPTESAMPAATGGEEITPEPLAATNAPVPAAAAPTEFADDEPMRKARPTIRPELIQQAAAAAAAERESAAIAASTEAAITTFVGESTAASEVETTFEDPEVAEPEASDEEAVEQDAEEPAEVEPEYRRDREPVAAGVGATASSDAEAVANRKGSYYSRRSAKLPRIGNDAGHNALAMASVIRGASRGGGPRAEPTGDVAVQTA